MLVVPLFISAFSRAQNFTGLESGVLTESAEIRVRLIDCRDARPYTGRPVSLRFFHREGTPPIPDLQAKTATDGTAVFRLSEGMPRQFMADPGTGNDLYPCSTLLPISVHDVVSQGMVSRCSKNVQGCRCKFGKAVSGLKAVPGELILFARPITRWERVRSSLWE